MKQWRKLQQFASKCMGRILYTPSNKEHEQQISQQRTTNYENRRKLCQPAIRPQLHKAKYATYRWKTTMSPAYLDSKLAIRTELKVWG